jgi:hypothetical protein
VAVHTLPEAEKPSDGVPFNKACPLNADDLPVAMFTLPARKSSLPEETCVLTITRGGMLKKSQIGELPGPSSQTFALCKVNDGDALGWVALTDGKKEILLGMTLGMGIRFKEDDIRPMGLAAAGVNGVKLGVGDEVIGAVALPAEGEVLVVASDGKAKRLEQKEIPSQGRYGRGVILWDVPLGVKLVGLALGKGTHVITLHLLKAAPKMTRLDEAGIKKRAATRGDVVVEVKPGDAVLGVTDGWMVEQYLTTDLKTDKRMATDLTTDLKTDKRMATDLTTDSKADKGAPAAGKKAGAAKAPIQGELNLGAASKPKKTPAPAAAGKAPAKGKPKPAAGSKSKETPAPAATPSPKEKPKPAASKPKETPAPAVKKKDTGKK